MYCKPVIKFVLGIILITVVCRLGAQDIILRIDPFLDPDTDCQYIETGAIVSFERGQGMAQCDPDVIIFKDDDLTPIFMTSSLTFDFQFEEPGRYIIFCGAPGGTEVATTAACFFVVDLIPTLDQWGIIILLLLILIASISAFKKISDPDLAVAPIRE